MSSFFCLFLCFTFCLVWGFLGQSCYSFGNFIDPFKEPALCSTVFLYCLPVLIISDLIFIISSVFSGLTLLSIFHILLVKTNIEVAFHIVLSSFLIYAFSGINFPLSIYLAASYVFLHCIFTFIQFNILLIPLRLHFSPVEIKNKWEPALKS